MSLLSLLGGLTLVTLTASPASASALWQVPAGSFAAGVPALQVELLEGATVIKTTSLSPTFTTATSEITLSTGERNSIGDWGNLRVRLTKSGAPIDVLRVQLETPALQPPLSGSPAVATWALPSGSFATAVAVAGSPAAASWALPTVALTTQVALTGDPADSGWTVVDTPPLVTGLAVAGDPAAAAWAVPSGTFAIVGTPVLGVELLEGATVRASWTATTPGGAALTDALTLTTGERNSIGDWGNLRVRLTKSGAQLDVLRVQLEAPVAGSQVTLATATASAAWALPAGSFAPTGYALSGSPAAASWVVPTGALTIPGTATLQVDLLEGATTRASWTVNPSATFLSGNFNLTTPQRDSIGDWSNLRLRLTKSGAQVDVSFARLEAPLRALVTLGGATVPGATWGVPGGTLITGLPLTGAAASASWTVVGSTLTASGPTLQVELLEGAAVRATFILEADVGVDVTDTFTLSTEQRDSIGNWGNLRVRLTQQGGQVRVYDLELEMPDAVSGAVALGAGVAAASWAVPAGSFALQVAVTGAPAVGTWAVPAGGFVSGLALAGATPFGRWAVPPTELVPSYVLPLVSATWAIPAGQFNTLVELAGAVPGMAWGLGDGLFFLGTPLGSGPAAAATFTVTPPTLPLAIKFKRRNWDERAEATDAAWLPRAEGTASGWIPRNEGDV